MIMSLDDNMKVPLLEMYMNNPPRSLLVAIIPRRPAIVIRDQVLFNRV